MFSFSFGKCLFLLICVLLGIFIIWVVSLPTFWDKVDITSFVCTKEYAITNSFLEDNKELESDYYIVCGIRNRTHKRIYAKLRYVYSKFNKVDIVFVNPAINPNIWTYSCKSVPFYSTDSLEEQIPVKLKRIEIDAK